MWTTAEWYDCLARMAAYKRRCEQYKSFKTTRVHGPMSRNIESDAEGYSQYGERYVIRQLTERQWHFLLINQDQNKKD